MEERSCWLGNAGGEPYFTNFLSAAATQTLNGVASSLKVMVEMGTSMAARVRKTGNSKIITHCT